MKNDTLISNLKVKFSKQELIYLDDLRDAIVDITSSTSINTITWKINQLKNEGLIYQKGRGIYSFQFKPEFSPNISQKNKRLYNRIKTLCNSSLSFWDTQMLNEIAEANVDKNWMFISTNKEELEFLFEKMMDLSKPIFLQPDGEVIERYLKANKDAMILIPAASEMPKVINSGYTTPSIEGILVNAWLKYDSYLKPIGFDLIQLYRNAFKRYNVNQSKLLRYAARRDKRKEINELIKTLI